MPFARQYQVYWESYAGVDKCSCEVMTGQLVEAKKRPWANFASNFKLERRLRAKE